MYKNIINKPPAGACATWYVHVDVVCNNINEVILGT